VTGKGRKEGEEGGVGNVDGRGLPLKCVLSCRVFSGGVGG
jgi:hypothetical protein